MKDHVAEGSPSSSTTALSRSTRPRRRRRYIAAIAAVSLLLCLSSIAWFPYSSPGRSSKLMENFRFQFAVRGSTLYAFASTPFVAQRTLHIDTFSASDMKRRKVLLSRRFEDRNIVETLFTERALLYVSVYEPPTTQTNSLMAGGGGGGRASIRFLLPRFLPSPVPGKLRILKQGEQRQISPRYLPEKTTHPALLHRVPLDGGIATETALNTGGYRLDRLIHAVAEEGVYWIRPVPAKIYSITRQTPNGVQERQQEIYQGDDLMFSPADGGPPRRRAANLSIGSLFVSGGSVYAIGFCPTPGHYHAVYRLPRSSREVSSVSPTNLHALLSSGDNPIWPGSGGRLTAPLEFGGRLYWLEQLSDLDDAAEPDKGTYKGTATIREEIRLFSCLPNGQDRRVVWDGRDDEGGHTQPKQIFLHQGRFYVLYAAPPPNKAPGVASSELTELGYRESAGSTLTWRYRVARLHMDRLPVFGESRLLPAGANPENSSIDAGWLYFLAQETQKSRLDFLYNEDTSKTITSLYRVSLPE